MLWVAEGEKLWTKPDGVHGQACAACHGSAESSMRGVATRYPMIDAGAGKLLNLEMKINQCRSEHQAASALAWESRELLGLTAFVTYQSRGLTPNVSINGAAQPFFEAGRAFFEQRQGQLNLSCSQCHEQNWGRRLRGDTISQGHPTGFPIYRLEWQSMGSLQRRLRACSLGVRAEVLDYGALSMWLSSFTLPGAPRASPSKRRASGVRTSPATATKMTCCTSMFAPCADKCSDSLRSFPLSRFVGKLCGVVIFQA
ncbi:MAG: sulfur oxidation c-type cytochrome SoxA [Sphingomonadales bacterium]|nr:sulfur oxidation c-type cytochrome SoxA [Sphingomonadales bacterium]